MAESLVRLTFWTVEPSLVETVESFVPYRDHIAYWKGLQRFLIGVINQIQWRVGSTQKSCNTTDPSLKNVIQLRQSKITRGETLIINFKN